MCLLQTQVFDIRISSFHVVPHVLHLWVGLWVLRPWTSERRRHSPTGPGLTPSPPCCREQPGAHSGASASPVGHSHLSERHPQSRRPRGHDQGDRATPPFLRPHGHTQPPAHRGPNSPLRWLMERGCFSPAAPLPAAGGLVPGQSLSCPPTALPPDTTHLEEANVTLLQTRQGSVWDGSAQSAGV